MVKRIKANAGVDSINHNEIRDEKIIHLKTTPSKNGKTHFYWNKSRAELIIGSKVHFPVISIAHLARYRKSCFDCSRDEIQLGDSVIWVFGKHIQPVVCATVIGTRIEAGERFLRLLPNNTRSVVPETWVKYEPNRFFLVSNNKSYRHPAPPNEIYASFQDELNKVEEIYAPIRTKRIILKYLTNENLSMGENTFKDCHRELFKGIYSWAGMYRNIEIVVTDRQFPTMQPNIIGGAMRDFCQKYSSKYLRYVGNDRKKMLIALVHAHKELAWIHPFEDGNGRTIRLYLELIAKTRGFGFNLTTAINCSRKKRYYHFAVRKAIEGHTGILTAFLNKVLI